jgi:hypothetical protein
MRFCLPTTMCELADSTSRQTISKKKDAHLQDIEKKQFISLTHEKSQ